MPKSKCKVATSGRHDISPIDNSYCTLCGHVPMPKGKPTEVQTFAKEKKCRRDDVGECGRCGELVVIGRPNLCKCRRDEVAAVLKPAEPKTEVLSAPELADKHGFKPHTEPKQYAGWPVEEVHLKRKSVEPKPSAKKALAKAVANTYPRAPEAVFVELDWQSGEAVGAFSGVSYAKQDHRNRLVRYVRAKDGGR